MKYILITPTGKVMAFNVLACAEIYLAIHGGTIISEMRVDNQTITY